MACSAVLYITAILVVSEATALHCSDVQSTDTASIVSEDGTVDLSEVTTIQYCIIDNCTIVRSDTGQQLDIIYTMDSHIVATPRGMQTTLVIPKMDDELVCVTPPNMVFSRISINPKYILLTLLATILVTVSGYNVIIHLMYRELRNLVGKLLMLYSFFMVVRTITALVLLILHDQIAANSEATCYSITVVLMVTCISSEAVGTCILTHTAYVMRQSHRMRRHDDDKISFLFKCYITFVISVLVGSLCLTLTYDLLTGSWRDTMLDNGRCAIFVQFDFSTASSMFAIITIVNKLIQITMFVVYLLYCYKLRSTYSRDTASSRHTRRNLFKIAVAMGATVGLSQLIFVFNMISGYNSIFIERIGGILLAVQQCAMVMSLRCIKTVYNTVCKTQT